MKQLFSVFPAGPAGTGLFVLRITCALQLAAAFPNSSPTWLSYISAVTMAALLVGVLTQLVAVTCMLLLAFDVLCGAKTLGIVAVQALNMLALLLLGAGAYSIDARLFGRRVINF